MNRCQPTDLSCVPCPQRLASCVGLPNGPNAIEGKQYSEEFVQCKQNRTMGTDRCDQGVFDPSSRQCEIPPTTGPCM